MSGVDQGGFGQVLGCCEGFGWRPSAETGSWNCPNCGRSVTARGGINYLVAEEAAHNRLEHVGYDGKHGIDIKAIRRGADAWLALIKKYSKREPRRVLELGAGTGFLTLGLNLASGIEELFSVDISVPFLTVAKERVQTHGAGQTQTHFFAADIQDLPFRLGSFDLIVGNSILHHIYDYGALLSRCAALLAEGGVAIFNEPVLQGKLVVAYLLRLIVETDEKYGHHFDEKQCKTIHNLVWLLTKEKWLKGNDEFRKKMEDKHIFDLVILAEKTPEWGYSAMYSENTSTSRGGTRAHAELMLRIMGLEASLLDPYQYLFDAYQGVVLDIIGSQAVSPHRYIAFRK